MATDSSLLKNPTTGERIPESMLRSFVTISGVSALSMFLGVIQNVAITAVIGATAGKDAYDIASYIPRMMLYFFGLDLFRGISISLFSRLAVNRTEDSGEVLSTLLNGLVLVSLLAAVVAELFVEPLVKMVGPGLHPETSRLAVDLARCLIPSLGLIAVVSLLGSVLLAHHYYGLTEGLAILPKLTTLVGVLVWGKEFGVWVLVAAIIAGLLAELPVMFYFCRRCGLRYLPVLRLNSPAIKSALVDAVPLAMGTVAVYFSEIVMQRTVSYGDRGTIACFNYSLMICGVLTILVGRPLAASLAPRITRSLEKGDYEASSSMFGKSLGMVVLLCAGGTAIVCVEAPIVVDVLFGRGKFTLEAIELTSKFLSIVFLGGLGIVVRMLAISVLLARRRVTTVMVYCLVTSVVRAGLAILGQKWWGVYASAVAYASGACVDGVMSILTAIWMTRLHEKMRDPAKIGRWVLGCLLVTLVPIMPHLIQPVSLAEPFAVKVVHLMIVCIVGFSSVLVAGRLVNLYTPEGILTVLRRGVGKSGSGNSPKGGSSAQNR